MHKRYVVVTVSYGMTFRFTVNPYYLLTHSMERVQKAKPSRAWMKTIERIKLSPLALLTDGSRSLVNVNTDKKLGALFHGLEKEFRHALRKPVFQRILQETETYRDKIANEWTGKQNHILRTLHDIAGLHIPKKSITVLVTHPKLHNGWSVPEKSIICWGHPEEWRNYSMVYLCHELLHILTHKKLPQSNLAHAVIELATDNELRIRLNGRGAYFHEGKSRVGHSELQALEQKLLPQWKRYLAGSRKEKNLIDFAKAMEKRRL